MSVQNELKNYIADIGIKSYAARLGVSESTVRHLLSGRRSMTREKAEKIELESEGRFKKEDLMFVDFANIENAA